MSFSEDVRRELVERPPARACCKLAFLSGLIRQAGSLQVRSGGELAVVAELSDPAAARLAFTLLRERGADCEILSFREHRKERRVDREVHRFDANPRGRVTAAFSRAPMASNAGVGPSHSS